MMKDKFRFAKSILITTLVGLVMWFCTINVASANCPNGIKGNGTNGIYIDINSEPYTTFRDNNGYWGTFAYGPEGCAWFASARANQLTGIGSTIFSGTVWWDSHYDDFGYGRGSEPRSKSLACYTNHVAVVEIVDGDVITVSEGGISKNSSSEYGHCVISTMTQSELESDRGTGNFLGYVYMADSNTDTMPIGYVDSIQASEDGITLIGWAFDTDEPEKSVDIHVYVDGAFIGRFNADSLRTDVDQVHNCGPNHGFEKTIKYEVSQNEKHQVQVFAINTDGSGNNPCLQNGNQEVVYESIEQRMKNVLTPQQFFVYQLTNIVNEPQYSMNSSVVDDDFFDKKEGTGLWGILSFTNISKWFLSTAEEDYYRKAMAECITLGDAQEEDDIPWEIVQSIVDDGVEALEENAKDVLTESQQAAIDVYSIGSGGLEYINASADVGNLLNRISYYSGSLLNALELVEQHAEAGSDIQQAAKYVVDTAYSTEMTDKFKAWGDQFLREVASGTVDTLITIMTQGVLEWSTTGQEVLLGDIYDKEMEELFYLNLQMEISSTFYSITAKYPNIMKAEYSNEELKNLWDLTLLYLKCGKLGFSYNFQENEEACIAKYQDIQSWSIPWNGETAEETIITEESAINISDYNVPGTLSEGDTYVVYGTVTSAELLRNVSIEISGANGYLRETADNINANQYDLYLLDKQIAINHLKAGEYRYIVTAETVNGNRKEVVNAAFTIKPEDGNMTISGYRLPKPMKQGDVFYVVGTINSQSEMSSVEVQILDANGNYMTGGQESGSFSTYDLRRLDVNVRFDILQTGTYHYVIKATNASGEEVLVDQAFVVR